MNGGPPPQSSTRLELMNQPLSCQLTPNLRAIW